MPPLLRCLLCKKQSKLFKIDEVYGINDQTIRKYIEQVVGPCIQTLLTDNDGVCSVCINLLNSFLYMQSCIFQTIATNCTSEEEEENSNKPNVLPGYIKFRDNVLKLDYDKLEKEADQDMSMTFTPAKSNMLSGVLSRDETLHAENMVKNLGQGIQRCEGIQRGRTIQRRHDIQRDHNRARRRSSIPKPDCSEPTKEAFY